jgi:hypothetical protein
MEVNINTYNMCASNYLGINIIKAIEPAAIVSDLPSECQTILFPSDQRYLMEKFRLEVEWPESDDEGVGLITKLFPNIKQQISEMKDEIIKGTIEGINNGKNSKCDKESPDERNLLGEDEDKEADYLDLNEEDILSIVERVVKEQMDQTTNVVDELKGSIDKLEALDMKAEERMQEMNERLENKMETKLEIEMTDEKLDIDNKEALKETLKKKMETKVDMTDEKLKTLEKKIEREFEVVDQKMDEMKNMIAQLLEQMAKQSSTETEEQ